MQQIAFIEPIAPVRRTSNVLIVSQVGVTSQLLDILRHGKDVVIAYSLSGGKDCRAMALEVDPFLDDIGFEGERVCIHADLDDDDHKIEWQEAQQSCHEIADYLGHKLLVVRRKNGGMITRWLQRWQANVERYVNLKCVRLICDLYYILSLIWNHILSEKWSIQWHIINLLGDAEIVFCPKVKIGRHISSESHTLLKQGMAYRVFGNSRGASHI